MFPNRRQMIPMFVASLGLGTLLAGCASGGGAEGDSGPRQDPNLITAEELAPHSNLTCLDAVRRLRPRWLQGRGGMNNPVLMLDGNRMGSAEGALANIMAGDVESLKYLSPTDARVRYGMTVTAGAIEAVSRRR